MITCPKCHSEHILKEGFRKTRGRGKVHKYRCKDCSKWFTVHDAFWHKHNDPKLIAQVIDLYFSSMSSRKVRDFLKRTQYISISHETVLDWCREYVGKVSEYVAKFKPSLSKKLYTDETEVKCKGQRTIFWCSLDWGTRYLNATLYKAHKQNMQDAIEFMHKIDSSGRPEFIQTDGLPQYPAAIKKVFGTRKKSRKVIHRVQNFLRTGVHNVRIETVFSKMKDRIRNFRGLKALWSANLLLQGIVIQHNFIQEHSTTKEHPSDLAKIGLSIGVNRWLGLIRLAS